MELSSMVIPVLMATLAGVGVGMVGLRGAKALFQSNALGSRRPREFHHHLGPSIPRCGGFGIGLVLVLVEVYLLVVSPESPTAHALAICFLFFGLGAWDDLRPLGAKFKLAGQVLIAILSWASDLCIDKLAVGPWVITNSFVLFWVTVAWLVAVPNLINLIDGSDGVAAGITLVGLGVVAMFGNSSEVWLVIAPLAGAILAFLWYNWPPARIYLGDGGAYLLGSLLAVMSLANHTKVNLAVTLVGPVLVLALPIADMLYAILRRAWRGLPLFRADRDHIHHRLLRKGFSPRKLAVLVYAFTLFCAVAAVVLSAQTSHLPLAPVLVAAALACVFRFAGVRLWPSRWAAWRQQFQARRRVQLALRLGRWLVRQPAACQSFQELWDNLTLVARRLGFDSVLLVNSTDRQGIGPGPLAGPNDSDPEPQTQSVHTAMTLGVPDQDMLVASIPCAASHQNLVFLASRNLIPSKSMRAIAEVLTEAWLKAQRGWMEKPRPEPVSVHWVWNRKMRSSFPLRSRLEMATLRAQVASRNPSRGYVAG